MSIVVKIAGIKGEQYLKNHVALVVTSGFTVNAVFAGNHVNGIRNFLIVLR